MKEKTFLRHEALASATLLFSLVLIVGLAVLIGGWFLGVEQLTTVFPGLASMKANTASCFVLAGISGLILARGWDRSSTGKAAVAVLSGAFGLIGLLTVCQYIFDINIGIDQFLVADNGDGISKPGRMGLNTSAAFAVTAAAILTMTFSHRPKAIWVAQIMMATALTIATVGIVGYIYSAESFGRYASFTPMALHTSILFILLLCGLFLVRSSEGPVATVFSVYTGGSVIRRLLPPLVVGLFALGAVITWLERTGAVDDNSEFLLAVFATASSIFLVGFTWWLGRRVNRAEAAHDTVANQAETFGSVLSSMAEGVLVVDLQGKILLSNPATSRILKMDFTSGDLTKLVAGYSVYQEDGKTPFPDDQRPTLRALQGESVKPTRLLLEPREDGESFWLEASAEPLYDRSGEIVGAVTVFHDVNESVKAQQELKQQEKFYRTIVNSAADAFVTINADGVITEWNSAAEKMFGYPGSQATGSLLSDLIVPPEMRDAHKAGLERYLTTREPHILGKTLELTAVRSSGEEFPVELAVFRTEANGVLSFHAFIRDIAERKQAQKRFESLLEAAPDAMVIVNESGEIVLINERVEELFGYQREELLNQVVEILVPESVGTAHHRSLRDGYMKQPEKRGMGVGKELTGRRKDGSTFPVEISLSPIRTSEGLLVSSAIRDITERKRMQEEADQTKDEFLASVSHELRTPLTSVLGYLEILLTDTDGLDPDVRRQLEIISRNTNRLQLLVADLLLVAQLNANHFEIFRQEVDFSELVKQRIESFKPQLEKANVSCKAEVDEAVALTGDTDRLGQLLDNLLSNAVKYSNAGGVVTVEVRREGGDAKLLVSDDGIGIPKREQESLFKRFFRAETAKRGEIAGVGLGLTITKAIVDAHKGTIELESEEGVGTTFAITLPLESETESSTKNHR